MGDGLIVVGIEVDGDDDDEEAVDVDDGFSLSGETSRLYTSSLPDLLISHPHNHASTSTHATSLRIHPLYLNSDRSEQRECPEWVLLFFLYPCHSSFD